MKRLVAMSFLLAALATPAILFIRPSAQASPGATITVNSTADTNDATLTFERKLISGEIRIQDVEKHAEVPL